MDLKIPLIVFFVNFDFNFGSPPELGAYFSNVVRIDINFGSE